MKKIETIWHHLLYKALTDKQWKFTQKNIAGEFGYSLSTVHHALEIPAQMGAVRKAGKFFLLEDYQKLLYYWASVRNVERNIVYKTYFDKSVFEIEGLVPSDTVYAAYSSARRILGESPADYAKVYLYVKDNFIGKVEDRFPLSDGLPNIFVMKMPDVMFSYGSITTMPHTFVDIWNMADWYSKDFIIGLENKINAVLS
jgi:hypothetical protein